MSLKQLSTVAIAIAIGTCTFASQANDGARYPSNNYWQAPNWSGFSGQPSYNQAPPAYNQAPPANNSYQRPPPPAYRQPPANYSTPPPPTGPYSGAQVPRQNPYRGAPAPRGPYNGPSAFNTPGYNPNYGNRRNTNSMPWGGGNSSMPWSRGNNRNGNNKFWGRSGPSTWMNPSKDNWENSWDDMINAPSRMGDMPGGWSAPEVTMPNPIDMGDQFQDNLQDLPEQMKDGNIGNDVSN